MDTKKQCPEFPYFGATYPDATCINGTLWDLDSSHGPDNLLHSGGNDSCPFCNPQAAYEESRGCWNYNQQEEGESDDDFEERMEKELQADINALRKQYGFEAFNFETPTC